jgi:hypothetical protein
VNERLRLQFRAEAINAMNHVQFGDPNTTVTSTAFGAISGERGHGQRQWNFVLNMIFDAPTPHGSAAIWYLS